MTLHLVPTWQDVAALGGVAGVVLRSWLMTKAAGIAENLVVRAERYLVRSEREAVEWLHYRDHAARQGHSSKHPSDCGDGECVDVR